MDQEPPVIHAGTRERIDRYPEQPRLFFGIYQWATSQKRLVALPVRTFRIGSDHKIIIMVIMVIINIILLSIYGIWFVDQSESAWLRLISLLGSGRIHPHEPLAVYTGMVLYTLDTQYEYKVQIVNPWWLWQKKQQKNKEKVRPAKLLDGPPRAINSQKSVRIEKWRWTTWRETIHHLCAPPEH